MEKIQLQHKAPHTNIVQANISIFSPGETFYSGDIMAGGINYDTVRSAVPNMNCVEEASRAPNKVIYRRTYDPRLHLSDDTLQDRPGNCADCYFMRSGTSGCVIQEAYITQRRLKAQY